MTPRSKGAPNEARTVYVTYAGREYLLAAGLGERCTVCGGAAHRKPRAIASDGVRVVICG